MRVLAMLTELFLSAFQITRPRPEQEQRTQLVIGGLMLLVLGVVAVLLAGLLVWAVHTR
ncbi:MAG TPA: hypothetical protein VGD62_02590 [Acidobacteriaceae bacterium]